MNLTLDLTEITIAVIGIALNVIVGVVSSKVLPYLRERGLDKYAKSLVSVALTLFSDGQGAEKFEYALSRLEESRYGKYFNEERLAEAVQAAYVELCTSLGVAPSMKK